MKRHVPSSFAINPNEIADFKYKPEQSLFKRTITLAILAVILVPLWIPFDYILDRQHFKIFLALRIALVIGVITTFLFSLKLKHSEHHHQAIALIIYLLLIVTILPMVIITDAKFPYLLGLSTCFFGISILIVWPLRYMAIPLVTTMVLFSVFSWNQIDIKQFISILFPLLTIGVLSLVASWFTYENHQNSEALLAGLNQLSFTDQLTELYNRRYLVLRLDDEIHRAIVPVT